jgi:hypothetical protein
VVTLSYLVHVPLEKHISNRVRDKAVVFISSFSRPRFSLPYASPDVVRKIGEQNDLSHQAQLVKLGVVLTEHYTITSKGF